MGPGVEVGTLVRSDTPSRGTPGRVSSRTSRQGRRFLAVSAGFEEDGLPLRSRTNSPRSQRRLFCARTGFGFLPFPRLLFPCLDSCRSHGYSLPLRFGLWSCRTPFLHTRTRPFSVGLGPSRRRHPGSDALSHPHVPSLCL